jgi:hypothetical protein
MKYYSIVLLILPHTPCFLRKQVDLKLMFLLPLPPKCWDYRNIPSCLISWFLFVCDSSSLYSTFIKNNTIFSPNYLSYYILQAFKAWPTVHSIFCGINIFNTASVADLFAYGLFPTLPLPYFEKYSNL